MMVTLPFHVFVAFFTTHIARPQAANASVKVKLNIQNVYSGKVSTNGRNVMTFSGGNHLCDGTNYGAHPHPGGTPTTALADAADKVPFGFNADWYQQYDDFAITEVQGLKCGWVFTINGKPVEEGGCQAVLKEGDIVDWYCAG